MTRNDRYYEFTGTVDADNRWIAVFVFQGRSYAADANAERTDEDNGVVFLPVLFKEWSVGADGGAAGNFILRVNPDTGAGALCSVRRKKPAPRKTIRSYAFRQRQR